MIILDIVFIEMFCFRLSMGGTDVKPSERGVGKVLSFDGGRVREGSVGTVNVS